MQHLKGWVERMGPSEYKFVTVVAYSVGVRHLTKWKVGRMRQLAFLSVCLSVRMYLLENR
jgi:hypothetical protein